MNDARTVHVCSYRLRVEETVLIYSEVNLNSYTMQPYRALRNVWRETLLETELSILLQTAIRKLSLNDL